MTGTASQDATELATAHRGKAMAWLNAGGGIVALGAAIGGAQESELRWHARDGLATPVFYPAPPSTPADGGGAASALQGLDAHGGGHGFRECEGVW